MKLKMKLKHYSRNIPLNFQRDLKQNFLASLLYIENYLCETCGLCGGIAVPNCLVSEHNELSHMSRKIQVTML